jgi:putative DNA primase/helicase
MVRGAGKDGDGGSGGDTGESIPDGSEAVTALHEKLFGDRLQAAAAKVASTNGKNGHHPVVSLSDAQVVDLLYRAKNRDKFRALWLGRWEGSYPSQSEADEALCALLGFYTRDYGQIDSIFRQSGLVRDKWLRRADYRERTISAALAGLTEVYVPSQAGDQHGLEDDMPGAGAGPDTDADDIPPETSFPDDPPIEARDGGEHLTDLGNSHRLVRYFGEFIKFSAATGWLAWDGKRFVRDPGRVMHYAKRTVLAIYAEAAGGDNFDRRKDLAKHAQRSEAAGRIQAMVSLAESDPAVRVDPDALDADPFLLNCSNGTLDLRTGELREHSQEDMITRVAPVEWNPEARSRVWERYLHTTFGGRTEIVAFVQRCLGYALTGSTREECLFINWGDGRNGKGTMVETMRAVLGDYAKPVPMEVFLARRHEGGASNDIAGLVGARLVVANEADEGRRLAEGKIKELTGGDRISARFLFHDPFSFTPQFKVFLSLNHRPVVRGGDEGIWSRIYLIPFNVKFHKQEEEGDPKRDPDLKARLLGGKEWSGILAWAVRGCLEWQRAGLQPPAEVLAVTKEYRLEMDTIGRFLEDVCEVLPDLPVLPDADKFASGWHVTAKALYEVYTGWCEGEKEHFCSKISLGKELSKRGFVSTSLSDNARAWVGLRLK